MDYSLLIALASLVAPEPLATGSVGPFGPVLEDEPVAVVGTDFELDPNDVGAPPANDLALGGTLAARYDRSFGRDAALPDEAGISLSDAIVAFRGIWYGYRFEAALEFDETNGSTLERLFVESDLDDRHRLRVGLIRNPFLYSSFADEDGFVFPYRTRLGREFMSNDEGLEFLADYGRADLRL